MSRFEHGPHPATEPAVVLWHGLVGVAIALESIRGMLARMPSNASAVASSARPAEDTSWLRAYA